tara:strand:+ start:333 stop:512 length:180 start_codon:yes stop_codon:yes gene_type:complete
MHKISSTLLLLLSFITTVLLSACGSKGDLYQSPTADAVVSGQKPNDAKSADEAQPEKLD